MTGNVERKTEEPNPTTKPLHNFTLPTRLQWSHQKHLRCMNSPADHSPISASVADGGDIEAVRHKLMTDFRAAAENIKLTILEHAGEIKKPSEEESKPWTLRSGKVNFPQPWKNKLSIALSREEIEADFAVITGAKPPRKPKKRPRPLQREIDDLSPGSWLMEVTPDKYKVRENVDQSRGES